MQNQGWRGEGKRDASVWAWDRERGANGCARRISSCSCICMLAS